MTLLLYLLFMKQFLLLTVLLVGCTSVPSFDRTQDDTGDSDEVEITPLSAYDESRITKKPFGLYVTPENSPVTPEKFRGFHAGTDYEVLKEEDPHKVEVTAICSGTLHYKKWVNGYGGVAVQACERGGEPMTVLYGHLDITSVTTGIGAKVSKGDRIGTLGKGFSEETDFERPHLHLSVHKGNRVELRGYVQNEADLSNWFDPAKIVD